MPKQSMAAAIAALLFAAALWAGAWPMAGRADVPPTAVDLALVLAIDVSGSIDPEEAALQRQGYVSAFSDPTIGALVGQGQHGRIAVTYFEWASYGDYRVVADWMVIDGPASAKA